MVEWRSKWEFDMWHGDILAVRRSVYFLLERIFCGRGRLARGRVLFRSCCRVVRGRSFCLVRRGWEKEGEAKGEKEERKKNRACFWRGGADFARSKLKERGFSGSLGKSYWGEAAYILTIIFLVPVWFQLALHFQPWTVFLSFLLCMVPLDAWRPFVHLPVLECFEYRSIAVFISLYFILFLLRSCPCFLFVPPIPLSLTFMEWVET